MDHDIDYRVIITELLKRCRNLAAVRLQVTPDAAQKVQRLVCSRLELSGKRVFVQKKICIRDRQTATSTWAPP